MSNPVRQIMEQVALKHRITLDALTSRSTAPRYAWPRQEAMYRASMETKASYREIATELGSKNHKSVCHGVLKHAERLEWLAHMTAISPLHADIHRKGYFTYGDKTPRSLPQQEVINGP